MSYDKFKIEEIVTEYIDTEWCKLRGVQRSLVRYDDLKESIASTGIHQNLIVRRIQEPNGNVRLSLIDGLHRLTIAKELGIRSVPCKIFEGCSDAEAVALQIQMNWARLSTRKEEFKKATKVLIDLLEDGVPIIEISNMLHIPLAETKDLLKLTSLPDHIQDLIDNGTIPVKKAVVLSDLPRGEIELFLEDAKTLSLSRFKSIIRDHLREIRSKDPRTEDDWVPKKKYIGLAKINDELTSLSHFNEIKENLATMEEVWSTALLFSMNYDERAKEKQIEERKNKLEKNEQLRKERQMKRKKQELEKIKSELRELEGDVN